MTSGSIFFSPSSVRTPLWKDATLEKILRMLNVNGKLRNCTFWIIKRMAPVLLVLTWPWHFMALVLTTLRRNMQLKDPRHYMHVDGRRKTVLTVLRGVHSLMFVMHLSAMTMLLPLAQMPIQNGGTGMKTMLWDINFILNWAGHVILFRFLVGFNTWELRAFHFLFTTCLTIHWHLPPVVFCFCLRLVLVFVVWVLVFASCFASVMGFYHSACIRPRWPTRLHRSFGYAVKKKENEGPPQLNDNEVAQMDHEASLKELVRLSNMDVINEYPSLDGN